VYGADVEGLHLAIGGDVVSEVSEKSAGEVVLVGEALRRAVSYTTAITPQ
jgi:hypothetical protein